MWIETGYKLINTSKFHEISLCDYSNSIDFYISEKIPLQADHIIRFETREEAVKCFHLISDRLLEEESLLILD